MTFTQDRGIYNGNTLFLMGKGGFDFSVGVIHHIMSRLRCSLRRSIRKYKVVIQVFIMSHENLNDDKFLQFLCQSNLLTVHVCRDTQKREQVRY